MERRVHRCRSSSDRRVTTVEWESELAPLDLCWELLLLFHSAPTVRNARRGLDDSAPQQGLLFSFIACWVSDLVIPLYEIIIRSAFEDTLLSGRSDYCKDLWTMINDRDSKWNKTSQMSISKSSSSHFLYNFQVTEMDEWMSEWMIFQRISFSIGVFMIVELYKCLQNLLVWLDVIRWESYE